MRSSLKEAFNLVQSGGAGIVGRAGGIFEVVEGLDALHAHAEEAERQLSITGM